MAGIPTSDIGSDSVSWKAESQVVLLWQNPHINTTLTHPKESIVPASSLFLTAVIRNYPATKDAQGNDTTPPSEVLADPKWVLAQNEDHAKRLAAFRVPEGFRDLPTNEVVVLVRPF